MTVFENLDFHGRYFGMSAKQAKAATDELLARCAWSTAPTRR